MILMLSGTSDGRDIGRQLAERGCKLLMTAVSQYGGERLPVHENIEPLIGHLTVEDMVALVHERGVRILLDATHPYAVAASENAIEAAKQTGAVYIRYERPNLDQISQDNVYYFDTYESAAQWLAKKDGQIFLTIGSRRLAYFTEAIEISRLVARVLPTQDVIRLCEAQGLRPNQIIAMQGPFSETLNTAMFEMHQSKYLVTKASSKIGGFEEKIIAASKLGMTALVIERPQLEYPNKLEDIDDVVRRVIEIVNI